MKKTRLLSVSFPGGGFGSVEANRDKMVEYVEKAGAYRPDFVCFTEVARELGVPKGDEALFSFTNSLPAEKNCGALPDGRRAHRPFANGVGPMHGMDRNGPTAMLRSGAKLNYLLSPNANTLDLKLSASIAEDGAHAPARRTG